MRTSAVADAGNRLNAEISGESIDAMFHRMLEVDRDSQEFADLWAAVDKYIGEAISSKEDVAA